jgi:DNA-binding response OmpR family regulator
VTFGVIEQEAPLVAELIALAFEAAGHDCILIKDTDHAARILRAIHLDSIVLDVQRPGRNGVDWLETMAESLPDLPSRALLLADAAITSEEEARIKNLGAEVVVTPLSIVEVELVVMSRLEKVGVVGDHTRRSPLRAPLFLN